MNTFNCDIDVVLRLDPLIMMAVELNRLLDRQQIDSLLRPMLRLEQMLTLFLPVDIKQVFN